MHPPFHNALYEQTLILNNIRPFSVNAFYYATGRIKTSAAWDYTDKVFLALSEFDNQEKLAALREKFNPAHHSLGAIIRVFYPKEVFYNKQGLISAKTIDVTNFEKSLIDCIMLKKFFDEEVPRGCKNLNTDDRYLTVMQSSKEAVDGPPRIEATILILPKT